MHFYDVVLYLFALASMKVCVDFMWCGVIQRVDKHTLPTGGVLFVARVCRACDSDNSARGIAYLSSGCASLALFFVNVVIIIAIVVCRSRTSQLLPLSPLYWPCNWNCNIDLICFNICSAHIDDIPLDLGTGGLILSIGKMYTAKMWV